MKDPPFQLPRALLPSCGAARRCAEQHVHRFATAAFHVHTQVCGEAWGVAVANPHSPGQRDDFARTLKLRKGRLCSRCVRCFVVDLMLYEPV